LADAAGSGDAGLTGRGYHPGMAFRPLEVTSSSAAGAAIVHVTGDVTSDGIDALRQGIAKAIAFKQPKVIVDLTQTSFLSSPGLAVLVQAMQLSQRNGSKLLLAGANDRVRGIFEISRLTEVFTMVPSLEEAIAR
jgi:anti-sigma B factor antagonist